MECGRGVPVERVLTLLDCGLNGLLPTSLVLIRRKLYAWPGSSPSTVNVLREASMLGGLFCQPPLFLLSCREKYLTGLRGFELAVHEILIDRSCTSEYLMGRMNGASGGSEEEKEKTCSCLRLAK